MVPIFCIKLNHFYGKKVNVCSHVLPKSVYISIIHSVAVFLESGIISVISVSRLILKPCSGHFCGALIKCMAVNAKLVFGLVNICFIKSFLSRKGLPRILVQLFSCEIGNIYGV